MYNMSSMFWKYIEIETDTSYFHSCNNSNFNHLNPLETYILVVAALNFRSDYRLRTHQWTERGNFDFSDPLVAFINVTIDHYIHSSLY